MYEICGVDVEGTDKNLFNFMHFWKFLKNMYVFIGAPYEEPLNRTCSHVHESFSKILKMSLWCPQQEMLDLPPRKLFLNDTSSDAWCLMKCHTAWTKKRARNFLSTWVDLHSSQPSGDPHKRPKMFCYTFILTYIQFLRADIFHK